MAPPRRRPSGVKPKRTGRTLNEGLGNVDAILQRQSEKREAGQATWVKVSEDDEEPTVVRAYDIGLFVEGYYHIVEFDIEVNDRARKGKKKTITVKRNRYCLDQKEEGVPCPGCSDEVDRRYKFWLPVIWRDSPIYKANTERITGYKDKIALLSGASRLVKVINGIQKKKGLVNQDIELLMEGSGFDVQYQGEALAKTPLSAEDKKLIKAADPKKWIDRYNERPSFEDFYERPDEDNDDEDDKEDVGERSKRRGSSFGPRSSAKKGSSRRQSDDEDDDTDDDERPTRTRRSTRSKAGARKPGGLSGLGKTSSKSKSSTGRSSSRSTTRRRRPPA